MIFRRRFIIEGRIEPVWGVSTGEILFGIGLIGVLMVCALVNVPHALASAAATEPLIVITGPRTGWMEHWAVHGLPGAGASLDTRHVTLGLNESSHYVGLPASPGDGSVTFTFTDATNLSGRKLTLRPALAVGTAPATLLWVCGFAHVPNGFTVVGENLTDVSREDLPSGCIDKP